MASRRRSGVQPVRLLRWILEQGPRSDRGLRTRELFAGGPPVPPRPCAVNWHHFGRGDGAPVHGLVAPPKSFVDGHAPVPGLSGTAPSIGDAGANRLGS